MKRKAKAKRYLDILQSCYDEAVSDPFKSDFKDGYACGIKVAIRVIKIIFEISE